VAGREDEGRDGEGGKRGGAKSWSEGKGVRMDAERDGKGGDGN